MTTSPQNLADADAEVAGHRPAHDERIAAGEHGHPSDATYIKIALILAFVTALEVGMYYIQDDMSARLVTLILLVMAAVKFAIVALYFMHLKFDNRVLRRLFTSGLVLAVGVHAAYMLTLGVGIGR